MRCERSTAPKHHGHGNGRHHPDQQDRREAVPIRLQCQTLGTELEPGSNASQSQGCKPDRERQCRQKKDPAVEARHGARKCRQTRGETGQQSCTLLDEITDIRKLDGQIAAWRHHKHHEAYIRNGQSKPPRHPDRRGRKSRDRVRDFREPLHELIGSHKNSSFQSSPEARHRAVHRNLERSQARPAFGCGFLQ